MRVGRKVRDGETPSPTRETRALPSGKALTRRRQLKESAKGFGGLKTHDEVLQFLALIFANDVAAERGELHGDFFLGRDRVDADFQAASPHGLRNQSTPVLL
jgi:hypothetical protein